MKYKKKKYFEEKLAENIAKLKNFGALKSLGLANKYFGMESVNNYYKKYNLKEKLIFANSQSNKVFKIFKNFD